MIYFIKRIINKKFLKDVFCIVINKHTMYDLQQLQNSYLPIDKLIYEYRLMLIGVNKHKLYTKYNPNKILFHSYITLPFIREPEIRSSINNYITALLMREDCGYLFYLSNQKMIIPLQLNFNAKLILDPDNYTEIMNELTTLAKLFGNSCTSKIYEIAKLEILYYLTILMNPHLNWITVDFVLRGNQTHDYLISSKNRIIEKTWSNFE